MSKFDHCSFSDSGLDCKGSITSPFKFQPPVSLGTVWVLSRVEIGRHTYMNDGYIREDVTIGRFCSIGRRVSIAPGRHPTDWLTTHPICWSARKDSTVMDRSTQRDRERRCTYIGHDVWIGDNAVVMPGVTIGTGAVVGANAVVTRDIAPYTIVTGLPARPMRKRFTDEIVSELLECKWWMLPDEAIKQLPMNNVASCIAKIRELTLQYDIVPFEFLGQ